MNIFLGSYSRLFSVFTHSCFIEIVMLYLFCVSVLISLSSGMPNHSASIQVSSQIHTGHNPSTPVRRWCFVVTNTKENFSPFGSLPVTVRRAAGVERLTVTLMPLVLSSALLPPSALCAEAANPDRRLGPELWAFCQCLQCVIFSLSACFCLWNSPPF